MTNQEDKACTAAKKLLRQQMIDRRGSLNNETCQLAAQSFRRTVPALLSKLEMTASESDQSLRIATYSAIRQEADLALACQDLVASRNAELFYPAISGRGSIAKLVFGKLPSGVRPGDFLAAGHFGVAEPPPSSRLSEPPVLDILFLPGLAFDFSGNRLGWGRAFYDNLIPNLPGKPVLVGVCHSFQIIPGSVPCGEFDQPVDWILTPDGMHESILMLK